MMKKYETKFSRQLWRDSEHGSSFSIEVADAIGSMAVLPGIALDCHGLSCIALDCPGLKSRFALSDFAPMVLSNCKIAVQLKKRDYPLP